MITYTATIVGTDNLHESDINSDTPLNSDFIEFDANARSFEIVAQETTTFSIRVTGHLWADGVEIDTDYAIF